MDLANTYNNIQVKLPLDPEFHIKCYYFSPNLIPSNSRELKSNNFFFTGSGKLTDSGLDSQSELLIKVSDTKTVNAVSTYLESITKNSIDWNLEIRRYTENYNNQNIKIVNYKPFIPHKGIINKNIKHIKIENAARTIDIVDRADSDEEKFAKESFSLLSEIYPNLNKDNWVVFRGLSKKEIHQRQSEYKIGSYFDREDGYSGDGWEIGAKRKICKVGAFYVDTEKGLCILFRENRKVIPYVVTQEVINKAEELGVKAEEDQNSLPNKKEMNKYIEFINTIRKGDK